MMFILTGGEKSDCPQALPLFFGEAARAGLADKGYDTDTLLDQAESHKIVAVIPAKKNRKVQREHDKELCKDRIW